jgi:divalent metal cation (Fe/Co/Zn/Cd) transporter
VTSDPGRPGRLLRRGRILEGVTLGWNVVGIVVLAVAGWWWADPLAALVIVGYALREAREIFGR